MLRVPKMNKNTFQIVNNMKVKANNTYSDEQRTPTQPNIGLRVVAVFISHAQRLVVHERRVVVGRCLALAVRISTLYAVNRM
jgi:hypothetical protein